MTKMKTLIHKCLLIVEMINNYDSCDKNNLITYCWLQMNIDLYILF